MAGLMTMARRMGAVLFCLCWALPLGCSDAGPTVLTGEAMGTRYHITLRGDHPDHALLESEITVLLERIEQQASQWRDQSWVSRFNRRQANAPMPVPEHVAAMLVEARRVYVKTGGVFDITAGPLIELWGFGADPAAQEPSEMQVAEAMMRCGFDQLAMNDDASVVSKQRNGVQLDFSALAKGYAVDRIARRLDSHGVAHYLIAFGGEVRAAGDGPGGDGWIVEVGTSGGTTITLRDQACATSGGSEQNRELGGRSVTHLIDPRTGRPMAEPARSVTIVAGRCITADAWATALAIDPSLDLPERVDQVMPD